MVNEDDSHSNKPLLSYHQTIEIKSLLVSLLPPIEVFLPIFIIACQLNFIRCDKPQLYFPIAENVNKNTP